MREISVNVVVFGDRQHYQMQYVDPITRKKRTRSTGVLRTADRQDRVEAERAAAKWEAELREGRYADPTNITWRHFRERYESEVLSGLSIKSRKQCDVVFDLVEARLSPQRVRDVDSQQLSWLVAELRKDTVVADTPKFGLCELTIKSYMAHLKASLRWAERVGLITKCPAFPKLHRARSQQEAKGRSLTDREFEALLTAVPQVVGRERATEWRRFLKGLWWSGFRIGESLELSWDRGAGIVVEIFDGEAVAHISASSQKSCRNETLPLAPEFGEMLCEIPAKIRRGPIFNPLDGNGGRVSKQGAIRIISDIGRHAQIKTWVHPKSGKPKYVSAHDLRRSFGTRWAMRVMPATLQQMMRHRSVETTMRFYVMQNAQAAASVIRAAYEKQQAGNISGNSRPSADKKGLTTNRRKSL